MKDIQLITTSDGSYGLYIDHTNDWITYNSLPVKTIYLLLPKDKELNTEYADYIEYINGVFCYCKKRFADKELALRYTSQGESLYHIMWIEKDLTKFYIKLVESGLNINEEALSKFLEKVGK
ncbi:MAG: hypothetical protein J5691_00745 [Bacilli bacterium]|nr:hypothetical protein [Bacilli bacterium]